MSAPDYDPAETVRLRSIADEHADGLPYDRGHSNFILELATQLAKCEAERDRLQRENVRLTAQIHDAAGSAD